jgi:predicted acetyltransferase
MSFEVRAIEPEELEDFLWPVEAGFGSHLQEDAVEDVRKVIDYERAFGALDGGQFVGGAGTYAFEMTLPGGAVVPVGGVTGVAVSPTHRRRGVLTQLMRHQLDDVAQRGEAFAILNASESHIYGRFGYGLGARAEAVEIDTREAEFLVPPADGRMRLLSKDDAEKALPAVYDRWRRHRPGALARSDVWWSFLFAEKESWKGGGEQFHVLHESEAGDADGYATYQPKGKQEHGNWAGTVRVRELLGLDADVEAALWRFCLDVDLMRTARSEMRPVDDPLRWRLVEPRQLKVISAYDVLWVRIVDVGAALSLRSYATDDDLVLDVEDSFRPDGSGAFRLDGSRTDDEPDLRLEVRDLGAAYLGGVTFSMLARAGRVEERRSGGLRRADALFASPVAPFCNTTF